jgi:hypothetical protein
MGQLFPTQPIDSQGESTGVPIYCTRNVDWTLDVQTSEAFYQIEVGTTGSVLVEGKDGNLIYHPRCVAGGIYPTCGIKIVSSGVVNGNSVATTASDIYLSGGK